MDCFICTVDFEYAPPIDLVKVAHIQEYDIISFLEDNLSFICLFVCKRKQES